jgi:hypothetical protein
MIASMSAASQPSTMSTPELKGVVFVVDNDVSVRESVDHLIHWAGWSVEAFASAEDFLAWQRRARACPPSSSRVTAISR